MYNIKYSVYEEADFKDSKSLVLNDLLNILDKKGLNPKRIVKIDSIFVSENSRKRKIGSNLIKELIAKYPSSIFITETFISKEEYKERPEESKAERILEELGTFLNKNGFYDINNYVGRFEYKKVYIYGEFYKDLILGIKKES